MQEPIAENVMLSNITIELNVIYFRTVHKSVNIESLGRLDRLLLSDVEEEDQPPLTCDVCKTDSKASAAAYCIDCAKKLCTDHEKVNIFSVLDLNH